MTRAVKRRVWIEDVGTYSKADGYRLVLDCRTPEQKPFSLTLVFDPQARELSVRGRNWALIEKMTGEFTVADWEAASFDPKVLAARTRHTFHWFKMDVDGRAIWLRDVRPCDPFPIFDPEVDIEAACERVEEIFRRQQ